MSEIKVKLTVTARPERGFRRAGKFFPASATEVEVTPEQAKALKAEPQLVVFDGHAAKKPEEKQPHDKK